MKLVIFLMSVAIVIQGSNNSSAQSPAVSTTPKRYALLVAVNQYEHASLNKPQLQFAQADAEEIGKFLKEGGYEVDLLLGEEAKRDAIMAKLAALDDKGNAEGAVVIGFFGHGVEYEGTNEAMFCPYDTKMRIAEDADGKPLYASDEDGGGELLEPNPKSLVGMKPVLNSLRICKAGNKLLIADCCRKSPNAARGRAFGLTIEKSTLPDRTAALFSCSQGEEAQEHPDWSHGAMTRSFLDLLPELLGDASDVNAITGRMSRQVSKLVSDATAGRKKQTLKVIVNGIVELRLDKASTTKVNDAITPWKFADEEILKDTDNPFVVSTTNTALKWVSGGNRGNQAVTGGYWVSVKPIGKNEWESIFGAKSIHPFGSHVPSHRIEARVETPAFNEPGILASKYCKLLNINELKNGRLPEGWSYKPMHWEHFNEANLAEVLDRNSWTTFASPEALKSAFGIKLSPYGGLDDFVIGTDQDIHDLSQITKSFVSFYRSEYPDQKQLPLEVEFGFTSVLKYRGFEKQRILQLLKAIDSPLRGQENETDDSPAQKLYRYGSEAILGDATDWARALNFAASVYPKHASQRNSFDPVVLSAAQAVVGSVLECVFSDTIDRYPLPLDATLKNSLEQIRSCSDLGYSLMFIDPIGRRMQLEWAGGEINSNKSGPKGKVVVIDTHSDACGVYPEGLLNELRIRWSNTPVEFAICTSENEMPPAASLERLRTQLTGWRLASASVGVDLVPTFVPYNLILDKNGRVRFAGNLRELARSGQTPHALIQKLIDE